MEHNISNKQPSNAISLIRTLCVCMIITCHMMQYANIELAYWFNVGVQIFLCISGFLYGGKRIGERLDFWKRRFQKILLDYYVVVIPVIVLYFVYARSYISGDKAVDVLLASATLAGGGHLWFVATILLCYGITPLIADCFDRAEGKKTRQLYRCVFVLMAASFLLCTKFFKYFNSAMINCYIFGFFLGRLQARDEKRAGLIVGIIAVAVGMNGIKILRNYVHPFALPVFLDGYWDTFCSYAHMMLGIGFFVVLYAVFSRISMPQKLVQMLRISDVYSYDVYLVHQFLILGPFSLMGLTAYMGVNILLILLLTAGLAYLVRNMSQGLANKACGENARSKQSQGLTWGVINTQRSALMGIAMLWIVFFHMTLHTSSYPILGFIKGLGNIGVDMFLFLSGIGLYFSWNHCQGAVWTFYKKRFKRIGPTTLFCLTPWFLYRATMAPTTVDRFLLDITSLSFWLDGSNPGWFIAELCVLYLLYPMVAYSMRKRPAMAFCFWSLAVVSVNFWIMKRFPNWYGAVEIALTRVPVFLCGCFLAPWTARNKRLHTRTVWAFGLVGAIFLGLVYKYPHGIFGAFYLTRYGYCFLAISLCMLFALCLCRCGDGRFRRLLRWVGAYTLEIYLIHTQLLRVLNAHLLPRLPSNIVINFLALGLTLILAVLVNCIMGAIGSWLTSLKKEWPGAAE